MIYRFIRGDTITNYLAQLGRAELGLISLGTYSNPSVAIAIADSSADFVGRSVAQATGTIVANSVSHGVGSSVFVATANSMSDSFATGHGNNIHASVAISIANSTTNYEGTGIVAAKAHSVANSFTNMFMHYYISAWIQETPVSHDFYSVLDEISRRIIGLESITPEPVRGGSIELTEPTRFIAAEGLDKVSQQLHSLRNSKRYIPVQGGSKEIVENNSNDLSQKFKKVREKLRRLEKV
jgi:hypothetical protein